MALTAIEAKLVDEITADDVRAFIAGGSFETETLEFKREAEPWAIRRAICGLANAYGGTFVLGVAERDGAAAALASVAACASEAARIAQGLASSLSPPLTGLRIRAIPIDGEAGVVVIRVPASARRPHSVSKEGRGEALHVFVRRGAETRAAGIREVQDMTLAASAQSQRVRDRVTVLQAPVLALRAAEPTTRLRPVFQIHKSAVPVAPIAMPRLDGDRSLRIDEVRFEGPNGLIRFQGLGGRWKPMFRGLRMANDGNGYHCRAALHADGACEIWFWGMLPPERHDEDVAVHFQIEWIQALCAARVLWVEKIRRAASEPALEFALGDLFVVDYPRVELRQGQRFVDEIGLLLEGVLQPDLGQLSADADVQQSMNQITADFYNLAGEPAPEEPSVFDLAPVRRAWGLGGG